MCFSMVGSSKRMELVIWRDSGITEENARTIGARAAAARRVEIIC